MEVAGARPPDPAASAGWGDSMDVISFGAPSPWTTSSGVFRADVACGSTGGSGARFARPRPETQLAEAQTKARPRDAEALYELGAVVGLQATYVATVDGKILGAFRAARQAYDAHEQVLEIDPARKDAGLIVGMYRYIVSAMSLPVRMMAYVAGFGGGKERGIQMIEEAAASATEASADAKFALVLVYNRESRYGDALRVLADLQRLFPRNRILWLEAGATALRAGQAAEAEEHLSNGLKLAANRHTSKDVRRGGAVAAETGRRAARARQAP